MREVEGQLLVASIFASRLLHTSTGGEKLGKQKTAPLFGSGSEIFVIKYKQFHSENKI
jgi:hypothetical protein